MNGVPIRNILAIKALRETIKIGPINEGLPKGGFDISWGLNRNRARAEDALSNLNYDYA